MPGRSCQGAHCLASEAKAAVPETLNVACTRFGPPEAMVSAHSDPSRPHFSQMCFSIRLAHIHHFHTIGQITLLPGSFHLPLIPPTTFAKKLPLFQMLCCWWRERKGEGGFIELLLCGGHNLKWLFCKVSQLKWQLPLCVPIGGCGRPREAALLLHLPPPHRSQQVYLSIAMTKHLSFQMDLDPALPYAIPACQASCPYHRLCAYLGLLLSLLRRAETKQGIKALQPGWPSDRGSFTKV